MRHRDDFPVGVRGARDAVLSWISAAAMAFVLLLIAPGIRAQSYPTSPIHIVNPFAAGGSSDAVARILGQKLGEALGQPIIIDSKPGANGNLGTDFVARAC